MKYVHCTISWDQQITFAFSERAFADLQAQSNAHLWSNPMFGLEWEERKEACLKHTEEQLS